MQEGRHNRGGEAEPSKSRESPYLDLSTGIMEYSARGEVILMGDFNAQTQNCQCKAYHFEDLVMMRAFDMDEIGIARSSHDNGFDNTRYGQHLINLGS